jgi:hypothetical protein
VEEFQSAAKSPKSEPDTSNAATCRGAKPPSLPGRVSFSRDRLRGSFRLRYGSRFRGLSTSLLVGVRAKAAIVDVVAQGGCPSK